ncbi:acyltransferase family protein [Micromonospora sp. LOL_023]|uniref:acyltransferase family protein n=1 Tax=Micromonospora sp. LOL_023 TaxID=3345418 RepID=UPI003A8A7382
MFGIAGHLMAASLDRYGPAAVARRMVRMILPFWAFSLVALALMHSVGRPADPARRIGWDELIWWILPLQVPSAGEATWAWPFTIGLWYISTYLWLILISPVALLLIRRWPGSCVVASIVILIGFHLGQIEQGFYIVSYLPCWLLGLASHGGRLQRIPARTFYATASALAVVGGCWIAIFMATHPATALNHVPIATTLWSMAWAVVLLRPHSRVQLHRLSEYPAVCQVLRLINTWAVTIYLWHIVAGALIVAVLTPALPPDSAANLVLRVIGMAILTALAVVSFGWVETLSSRYARLCKISPGHAGPGR